MLIEKPTVRCFGKTEYNAFGTEATIHYHEYPIDLDLTEYTVTPIICPVCQEMVTLEVLPALPFRAALSVGFQGMKRYHGQIESLIPVFWLEALKPLFLKVVVVERVPFPHHEVYNHSGRRISSTRARVRFDYDDYDRIMVKARVEYYLRQDEAAGNFKRGELRGGTESQPDHPRSVPTETNMKFKCPKCRKGLQASYSIGGKRCKCPACGQNFVVPANLPRVARPSSVARKLVRAAMLTGHLEDSALAALESHQWKPSEDSLRGAFILLKLSQNDHLGISVSEKLARAGQLPAEPLIAALSDKDIPFEWRIKAGDVLSTMGDTRATIPLVELLREANATGERSVRTAAIIFLMRLEKAAFGPVDGLLGEAINQQNEDLQSDCLTILHNIKK
jgi:ribosomal protein L37AE/L43A